jgi:hypothetical protein
VLTCKGSIGNGEVRVVFSERPPDRILAVMKGRMFRWSKPGGYWWRRCFNGAADFLAALDRMVGPRRPDGACWRCQAPEGYFRPQGAATPVYCDTCYRTLTAPPENDRSDLEYEDRCREACGL